MHLDFVVALFKKIQPKQGRLLSSAPSSSPPLLLHLLLLLLILFFFKFLIFFCTYQAVPDTLPLVPSLFLPEVTFPDFSICWNPAHLSRLLNYDIPEGPFPDSPALGTSLHHSMYSPDLSKVPSKKSRSSPSSACQDHEMSWKFQNF